MAAPTVVGVTELAVSERIGKMIREIQEDVEDQEDSFDLATQLCELEMLHTRLNLRLKLLASRETHDYLSTIWREGAEADRPEDLPVPPNADRRYDEMDGG